MKKVLIIQSSLRGFFFNFGNHLRTFEFIKLSKTGPDPRLQSPANFESEIKRRKDSWFAKFRRIVGLLNIRPFFSQKGDLVFTYGCVLLSNKPYCVCMENGLAVFNYDPILARHPLARLILSVCILDPHLRSFVFLSNAAKRSFFSGVKLPGFIMRIARSKARVCYPITGRQSPDPLTRSSNQKVHFLFAGYFYMKGGVELVKTVEKLNHNFVQLFDLTIVTQLKLLHDSDITWMRSIPNINLIEANLTSDQMNDLYLNSDTFIYPTYRDSFGLVILEAVSWGLPIICTSQFAVSEMVKNNITGFVLPRHPLQDYNLNNYAIQGRYYQPEIFYHDLFEFQAKKKFRLVENFLYRSMKKLINSPRLLNQMKYNTSDFYRTRFDYRISARKIERVFTDALLCLK